MIKFDDVTKIYPTHSSNGYSTTALKNISFEVAKGEFLLIIGKSGAGKTTLIRLLESEEKPTFGKIFYNNEDISKIKTSKLPIYRRKLGVIYQDYKLLPQMNVFENVSFAMMVTGKSDSEIRDSVPKTLEIVDLIDKINNFPNQLSSGEKQRLAIARAIVNQPEVILADEPTGNLDCYFALDIVHLLEKINRLGTTVILATHDRDLVNHLRKRVITLEDGEIIRDDKEGKLIF